jgi:hypothetical protein
MKKVLFVLLLLASAAQGQSLDWKENKPLQKIKLTTSAGDHIRLRSIDRHNGAVIVFLSPECPLSQVYTRELNELYEQHKHNDIAFYGVFPGKELLPAQIEAFRQQYKLRFPILMDVDYRLSSVLEAKVTPEVFLCDPWGGVHYRGAIDDRAVSLGKLNDQAQSTYLFNAIELWLMQEPIWPSETTAVGCIIELP